MCILHPRRNPSTLPFLVRYVLLTPLSLLLQLSTGNARAEEVDSTGKPSAAESSAAAGNAPLEQVDPTPAAPKRPTIFGRPIDRSGFHFHASLGIGGGTDTAGLYHAMEIGWSFKGYTFSFLHALLQNKNELWTDKDGPDEFGGFFAQVQGPIYFDDLVWKFAAGVGGTVDQPDEGGFYPHPGFGVHYGVDLHFPIWPQFGPTLSLAAMNVVERGDHTFGVATALGITVF
jgi:hypothetical protein